jgi:biofilm protein TabA
MILDTIDAFDAYCPYRTLSPLIGEAMDWLRLNRDAEDGRYPLVGDRLFAMVQTYTTGPASERKWEAHRRYVDLQCILSGVEAMGYASSPTLAVAEAYDRERDAVFFEPPAEPATRLVVAAGQAVLFAPGDAHQPGVAPGEPAEVRKVVFKLATGELPFDDGGVAGLWKLSPGRRLPAD